MRQERIAERLAQKMIAGEDWEVTEEIKKLIPEVVREIQKRGGRVGRADKNTATIQALAFYVPEDHFIPLDIQLFEGSWSKGKVIVRAKFNGNNPVPVRGKQTFNARDIVDAIQDGFMSLVNEG